MNSILEIAVKNIGSNVEWDSMTLNAFVINKMVEITAFYTTEEQHNYFNPKNQGQVTRDEDLTFLFKDLREEMYSMSSDKGAWFTAYFTVKNNGQFQTHFEYEEKPEFTYAPSKEKYIDDLNKFPREKSLIPQWLKNIVNS
nr:immunity protein YezG family protein [Testudinibacter sp. TR-2022]